MQLPSADARSKLEPGKFEHKTNCLLEQDTRKSLKLLQKRVVQTSELMLDCYKDVDIEKKIKEK